MKLTLALVGVLLIAPTGQAATPVLSFDSPAQVTGNINGTALQWILLLLHGPDAAAFHAKTEGGSATNHSVAVLTEPHGNIIGHKSTAYPMADLPSNLPPLDAQMRFDKDWASLYIAADSISVSFVNAAGALQTPPPQGTAMDWQLPQAEQAPAGTFRVEAHKAIGGVAFGLRPTGSDHRLAFQLTAHGLRMLEWHNATFTCQGSCPDGAGSVGAARGDPLGSNDFHLMYFQELQLQGGDLTGMGHAWLLAAGGESLNLSLQGTGRFPRIEMQECPGGCPQVVGRTLQTQGQLELLGLHRTGNRMTAGAQGNLLARLDESHFDPSVFLSVGVASGTVLAGMALLAWWVVWTGLFSRITGKQALENPRRRVLMQLIEASPGMSVTDLATATGIAITPLRYHLNTLKTNGLVAEHLREGIRRFFPNHGAFDKSWQAVAALRNPETRQLYDLIGEHPGALTVELARLAHQAWGWSQASTYRRVEKLAEAGLLTLQPKGKRFVYFARPLPQPEPALPGQSPGGSSADAPPA